MARRKSISLKRLVVDNAAPAPPEARSPRLVQIEVVHHEGEASWADYFTGQMVAVCDGILTMRVHAIDDDEGPLGGLGWLVNVPMEQICEAWELPPSAEAV